MNKERFEIELNQEDVQNIINCYEKDIEYINQLQQQNKELHNKIDKAIKYIEWQRVNPQYDNVWRNFECDKLIEILKDSDIDDNR